MEIRIKLGEPEFRALCRGGEVKCKNNYGIPVAMILADIGFGPMSDAVDDAISGKDLYKGVTVNNEGEVIDDQV